MWSITLKDLQIFLKDRGSVIYLFVLPILFILMFAGIGAAAGSGGDEEKGIPLPVVNLDSGGKTSQELIRILEQDSRVEVRPYQKSEADEMISEAEIDWMLFIPENFSADFSAGKKVVMTLVLHPNHNPLNKGIVEMTIDSAARDIMLSDYLLESIAQLRRIQAVIPSYAAYFEEERVVKRVNAQMEQAKGRPLVVIDQTTPMGKVEEDEPVDIPELGHALTVGFAVLFVFLASQNTAQSIFEERRLGSFRRLIAAPISLASLLAGKMMPNMLKNLLQIAIILLVGALLLPLVGLSPLDLGSDPVGLLTASIVLALCSASLGIFIISIARTEAQVGGITGGLLWIMGFIGGSIIPVFMMPDSLKKIAMFTPQYWANQAFYGLILRGETLVNVWQDLAILLGFSLLFMAVGLWRFKFD